MTAPLGAIGRPVVIGFEATGNYHRRLAHRLLSAVFELRLVSSVALARTREALHSGWDKNDPKDAQVILHMLRIGATQRYVDPLAAGINDLQELSKTHEVISKAKTQTWHRILTHYLPLYFPRSSALKTQALQLEIGDRTYRLLRRLVDLGERRAPHGEPCRCEESRRPGREPRGRIVPGAAVAKRAGFRTAVMFPPVDGSM